MKLKHFGSEATIEAAQLKALFKLHRNGLTQEEFGQQNKISGQGMVCQYLNGRARLNRQVAQKFAVGLGVAIDQFSPRLAVTERGADAVLRVNVSLKLRPEIKGKMMQIAGAKCCSGNSVHLYQIYEEALLAYIEKNMPI